LSVVGSLYIWWGPCKGYIEFDIGGVFVRILWVWSILDGFQHIPVGHPSCKTHICKLSVIIRGVQTRHPHGSDGLIYDFIIMFLGGHGIRCVQIRYNGSRNRYSSRVCNDASAIVSSSASIILSIFLNLFSRWTSLTKPLGDLDIPIFDTTKSVIRADHIHRNFPITKAQCSHLVTVVPLIIFPSDGLDVGMFLMKDGCDVLGILFGNGSYVPVCIVQYQMMISL